MNRTRTAAALLAVGLLGLAGCSSSSSSTSTSTATTTSTGSAGAATAGSSSSQTTITVFAAASLKESFTEIAKDFQAAHPGTTVKFNFGGSSTLAEQVVQGAPADVFAAASTTTMETASKASAVGTPVTFATNTMEIAVPTGNPGKVKALSDLTRKDLTVALCQQDVPCGAASQKMFSAQKLTVTPATWEPDVKSVLSKVELDEADAGIVYTTDVKAAGSKVTGITIPAAQNVETSYPIATVKASRNQAVAQQFVDFVNSAKGKSVLAADGFTTR